MAKAPSEGMKMSVVDDLEKLESWFSGISGTITAFSGGIDSTLVLFLSKKVLGDRALGCISISPSLKRDDYAFAIDFCEENNISLEVIETTEIDDPNYFANPVNRCYFCKTNLYQHLEGIRKKYPDRLLLNGTNADDLGDYRPGLKAADELNVRSPLAECGINKESVREIARYLELPNWNKPASPCLSSRIPYGNSVTREKLRQIESAEKILLDYGYEMVRVRHFGKRAIIEVPEFQIKSLENIMDQINPYFLQLGFESVTVDSEGFVSGKLNRTIKV